MAPNIDSLLESLTLEEKISLLAGKNWWETVPIPSKGIPSIKSTDGPNGARGEVMNDGSKAACFPAACCSASTWNPVLTRRIGEALAEETLLKGARVLLGPTICNHRHPLGGRNFESFSEDPYLTGKLAAQVVQGLQSKGVAATVKHFVANEQETERLSVDEIISERALREIYLKPFEICVREAQPWAVMTAYNKINGTHADSNEFNLKTVLRGDWNWNGLVMSDWGGTNSGVEGLNAGLDLEMPGPARWRKVESVLEFVEKGLVSEETITERARNVLELIKKVGGFENPVIPPERSVDNPAHRALIREVAGQGLVLLKNDGGILPLRKENVKSVALLGLAKEALMHGGGSARLNPHYQVTPWDGLRDCFGDDVEFKYAKGVHTYRQLPAISSNTTDLNGTPGWTMEYFPQGEDNNPDKTAHGHANSVLHPLVDITAKWHRIKLSANFTPDESGSHYLSCSGLGKTTISINDKIIFEQKGDTNDPMAFLLGGVPETEFTYPFHKGEKYLIEIDSSPAQGKDETGGILEGRPGFRLGLMTQQEHDLDLLSEAVAIAQSCDIAIVFTGHTPVWETEGQDQLSFHLPKDGSQDNLVNAIAAANPRTVVVNSTGVAVAMPWLPKVSAVLQAWLPGQEAGNAIADVLSGRVNPSGKLPASFPKRIQDAPAYGNFPGSKKNGQLTVRYEEGVFVGYRHYDRLDREVVNFPFGFGLSYTRFVFADGAVSRGRDKGFVASVRVSNTGGLRGGTVVQLYAGRAERSTDHPVKVLVAFQKVFLDAQEIKTVELVVEDKSLAYWDESGSVWKVDGGRYDFSFATSSADVECVVSVEVEGMRLSARLEE